MSEIATPPTTRLSDLFWRWVANGRRNKAQLYRREAADLIHRAELLEFEAEALRDG